MMAPLRNSFFGFALALMTACYTIPASAQATIGGTRSTTHITASTKNLDPADWEPILLESAAANDVPKPQSVDSRRCPTRTCATPRGPAIDHAASVGHG